MKRIFYLLYLWLVAMPIFVVLTILTAVIVMIGCLLGGQSVFSYYPGKIWSWLTCYLMLCPVRVRGRNNLDADQSYVFVANHQGAFDIFLIYGFLGVPMKWVMKAGIAKIPFVGAACRAAGFIFVDNTSAKSATQSVYAAEKCLKSGSSIVVFPEGSRSYTGRMIKFKKGAFQMAVDLHVPIVPISLNGPFDVLKIGNLCPHPHRLEMIIHEPINTDDIVANGKELQQLAEKTQGIIASGLWEKYK